MEERLSSYTRTISSLPKGALFTRYCIALARSHGRGHDALKIAEGWRDTPTVASLITAHNKAGPNPIEWRKAAIDSDIRALFQLGIDDDVSFVPTTGERECGARVRNHLNASAGGAKVLCAISDAGSGKTTELRRVAYDLAKEGHLVFNLNSKSTIDSTTVASVLSAIDKPLVLVVDGLADHAASVRSLLATIRIDKPSSLSWLPTETIERVISTA